MSAPVNRINFSEGDSPIHIFGTRMAASFMFGIRGIGVCFFEKLFLQPS